MHTIKKKPEDFKVKEISALKPSGRGKYLYAVLEKKDFTTMSALTALSRFLHLPINDFGFAGAKDRHAVTEQLISINARSRDVIVQLRNFKNDNISVTPLGFSDHPVSLGDLEGNRFRIVVRDADSDPKKLLRAVNYYGEQRFSGNNATVGKLLVLGKFSEALDNINEPELRDVSRQTNDPITVLRKIPKKILLMYVHAYQSLLWNRTVDRYLETRSIDSAENVDIPLIGFGLDLDEHDDEIQDIINTIMEEEGVDDRTFINRKVPELSAEGGERKLFVEVKDLTITKKEKGVFILEFFLSKGSYATEVVKQMFC